MNPTHAPRRGRAKTGTAVSALILFFSASSILYAVLSNPNENYFFEFRYMTVSGTAFTAIVTLISLVTALLRAKSQKAPFSRQIYYFKLCSAVTECIIAVVILLSLFPFVPDTPSLLSYDSFCMHVIIPTLAVVSFLLTPPPPALVSPLMRLTCTWMITLYAVVVITLIVTGLIPQEKIPYSFLDFNTRPINYSIYFGCFIYSFTYIISVMLTDINGRIANRRSV